MTQVADLLLAHPIAAGGAVLLLCWWVSYQAQGFTQARRSEAVSMLPGELCRAARLSVLAYPQSESNRQWKERLPERIQQQGGKLLHVYSASGVDVLLCEFAGVRYLAIRGTHKSWDWMRDAFACKIPAPLGGRAHAGFLRDARQIFAAFHGELAGNRRVIVCGHSMGAAEAIELSAICEHYGRPVAGIVALCAPRSGDRRHADIVTRCLKGRLIRITNARDLVAMVPPRVLGFHHAGKTHYFDSAGDYHADLTVGFRIADLVGCLVRDARRLRLFRDLSGYHSAQRVAEMTCRDVQEFRLIRPK